MTVRALPEQVTADISTVLGWMLAFVAAACVAKIIFVGARMAWDHQHTAGVESPVAAEFIAAVVGWVLAAAAAAGIATALLGGGSDPAPTTDPNGDLVEQIERVNPPLEGQQR